MKKLACFVSLCFLSSSLIFSQTTPKHLPAKPPEEKEIKADRHLEKEIQQKQLSDKPVVLSEGHNQEGVVKKNKKMVKKNGKYVKSRKVIKKD